MRPWNVFVMLGAKARTVGHAQNLRLSERLVRERAENVNTERLTLPGRKQQQGI